MTLRKRQRVVEPEQPESNVELQEAEPLFPTAQAEAQAMQAVDGQEIEIDLEDQQLMWEELSSGLQVQRQTEQPSTPPQEGEKAETPK